ncbi:MULTISPECIES: anthranilate synthase component II [Hyphobacterium]|uniref:Anthranilate synthase component II n=1 Tax=Hyphobacterium vulgare TaxID=1736751 RepID=A0ABV6ZSZ2_9PROT
MLLIIDNYDSFTFNLVHYFQELGAETRVVRNDAMSTAEAVSSGASGIVISPGPGRPADAGICPELTRMLPETLPLLGVCLGHQGIGEAFGGKIVQAKSIMHGKTSAITHDGTGVFTGLPSPFDVTRYHSLAVEEASLSGEIVVNARTADGEIMGLRHRERPIHGVQFHPESIASQYGHEILANFLSFCGVRPKVAA